MAVKNKLFFLILFLILLAVSGVSSFALETEESISNYDVTVRINTDGSLDITENIRYSSLSGYNNVMVLIDKKEWEEIEIKNVYMLDTKGYIKCTELSEGQWDVNAFMGTYSLIDETDAIRLKVYGRFSSQKGTIVVQYTVINAILRYNDVAEYSRTHIFKNQNNYISDIDILVYLPMESEAGSIKPFLHGVLLGNKNIQENRVVVFRADNIVPKEYVDIRIAFPEQLVFNAPFTSLQNRMSDILEEEEEYNLSDKQDLVRARENAAKEAGRRALLEKIVLRTKIISSIASILATTLGLYIFLRFMAKIRQFKKLPLPEDLSQIELLTPAEARFVISGGRTGGRSILASILHLVAAGFLGIKNGDSLESTDVLTFCTGSNDNTNTTLYLPEKYVLDWIYEIFKIHGECNPKLLREHVSKTDSSKKLKLFLDEYERLVLREYSHKNLLENTLLYWRNISLTVGMLLFLSGCIVPVAFSIWAGYAMIPVGLILVVYSLRIHKFTEFSSTQYRLWKEIRNQLLRSSIDLSKLPQGLNDAANLLSYSIALRAEKNPELIKTILNINDQKLPLNDMSVKEFSEILNQTLQIFDKAFSSVRDVN